MRYADLLAYSLVTARPHSKQKHFEVADIAIKYAPQAYLDAHPELKEQISNFGVSADEVIVAGRTEAGRALQDEMKKQGENIDYIRPGIDFRKVQEEIEERLRTSRSASDELSYEE